MAWCWLELHDNRSTSSSSYKLRILYKKNKIKAIFRLPSFVNIWFSRLITYLFYCISLVFFFAPDPKSAYTLLSRLTSFDGPSPFTDLSLKPFEVVIYIPLFLFLELMKNDYPNPFNKLEKFWLDDHNRSRIFRWVVYSIVITVIYIAGFKSQQFIYANF